MIINTIIRKKKLINTKELLLLMTNALKLLQDAIPIFLNYKWI